MGKRFAQVDAHGVVVNVIMASSAEAVRQITGHDGTELGDDERVSPGWRRAEDGSWVEPETVGDTK